MEIFIFSIYVELLASCNEIIFDSTPAIITAVLVKRENWVLSELTWINEANEAKMCWKTNHRLSSDYIR